MRAALVALAVVVVLVVGVVVWAIGVQNRLVGLEQDVNEKWAQVQNVYQRRADLIPNLVETVKGFAAQHVSGKRGGRDDGLQAEGVLRGGAGQRDGAQSEVLGCSSASSSPSLSRCPLRPRRASTITPASCPPPTAGGWRTSWPTASAPPAPRCSWRSFPRSRATASRTWLPGSKSDGRSAARASATASSSSSS